MENDLLRSICDIRSLRNIDTPPELLRYLLLSIKYHLVKVFYSPSGEKIGYIAWANVSKENIRIIIKTRKLPIYYYEFNDGKNTVIYDMVCLPDWEAYAKQQLMNYLWEKKYFFALFRRGKLVGWLKKNGRHKYKRFWLHTTNQMSQSINQAI